MFWTVVVLAVGSIMSVTAAAQATLPWQVIGSGGSLNSVGTNRILSSTVGQVVIGPGVLTDGSDLQQGFWLPLDQTVSVDNEAPSVSTSITNYPNPFSTSTTIRFNAPVEGDVLLQIFNVVGERVRSIRLALAMTGNQEVPFDGLSDTGAPLATGSYLYELTLQRADGTRERLVQRMSVVR